MTARTAVLITLLLATSIAAQDRTVRGVVLDASTGAPIIHASVMAMVGTNAAGTVVESDERGGFVLTAPAPAPSLRIAKAGYALTTVAVPTGDPPLEIRLVPGAAITGRLLNEAGVPLVGMFINAYPVARDGTVEASSPHMAMVDDRGEFRIGSLPEGRYVVGSTSESGQVPLVLLRPGDEIEVPLEPVRTNCGGAGASASPPARARASVVRGRVLASTGAPLACAIVRLVPVGAPAAASQFRTVTDARGRFEFHAVPAAAFTVETLNSRLGAARVGPIDVPPADANHVDDIELRMIPHGVITGTVVDDRGEPLVGVMVTASELRQRDGHVFLLDTAMVPGLPALTDDRGRFRIFGLRTGRYVVS